MLPVKKIRVLVVDDSLLFREVLIRNLSVDPRIEVVGSAIDPFDALEKIKAIHPDVITLDVEMPKMDGISFLKKLMPIYPTPVVVVSSTPMSVLDALDAGAVDFVRKPQVTPNGDLKPFFNELLVKIKIASTAKVAKSPVISAPIKPATLLSHGINDVIAIGASTGGTEAIIEVVKNLPPSTPGIVVVQHMPPVFTAMYAQRLNKICQMSVKEAENGDRVEVGKILIAAGDAQMRLLKDSRGYYVKCTAGEAKVSGHCPSVDVLFDSVAVAAGANAIGIILTGMGSDGARGMLSMRKAGAHNIGQDKDSCVVYGMPKVAFDMGGVVRQSPLSAITNEVINELNKRKR